MWISLYLVFVFIQHIVHVLELTLCSVQLQRLLVDYAFLVKVILQLILEVIVLLGLELDVLIIFIDHALLVINRLGEAQILLFFFIYQLLLLHLQIFDELLVLGVLLLAVCLGLVQQDVVLLLELLDFNLGLVCLVNRVFHFNLHFSLSLDAAVCSALLYCDLIFEFLQPCGELVHFRFLQLDILAHFLVFDG